MLEIQSASATAILLSKFEETAKRGNIVPNTDTYEWCLYRSYDTTLFACYNSPYIYKIDKKSIKPLTAYSAKGGKYACVNFKTDGHQRRVNVHTLLCCMLKKGGFKKLYELDGYTVNHLSTYNNEFDIYRNLPLRLEVVNSKLNNKHGVFVKKHSLTGVDISAYDIDKFENLFREKKLCGFDIKSKKKLVNYVYQMKSAEPFGEYKDYRCIYDSGCVGIEKMLSEAGYRLVK